ncbi:hypothetical protein [Ensifer soli]|uniref:hypothetical protein n=1 Tax=Ciceribacter sp. sgz301302 TaxID=3342379 RepID=UPI0035BADCDE
MKELVLAQIMQVLPDLIDLLISVILGVALLYWRRWTGIEIEAKRREALQSALSNAAKLLLLDDGDMDDAVFYVRRSVPDALAYFGLDDEDIETYLAPKIAAQGRDPMLAPEPVRAEAVTGLTGEPV